MTGDLDMPWGATPAEVCAGLLAMDTLVHGWDMAQAVGVKMDVDDLLAEDTLAFCVQVLSEAEMRGHDFRDRVPVSDDAPMMDQLVAFLGREP